MSELKELFFFIKKNPLCGYRELMKRFPEKNKRILYRSCKQLAFFGDIEIINLKKGRKGCQRIGFKVLKDKWEV